MAANFLENIFGKKEIQPLKDKSSFEIKESDVFLVSYPKSGNTWMRFLFGNYMSNGEMDFSNGHIFMPEVHSNPEQIAEIPFSPRIIKSHFPYRSEYKSVIYLARDGRDTAVSYYYFLLKMKGLPRETTFSDYFENYFFAGKSVFGHWDQHVFSWLRDNKVPRIISVKYEDLLQDTEKNFRTLLEFSGITVDEERLKNAVLKSSFKEMQKDEEKNSDALKQRGHIMEGPNLRIVREGKTNSWKTMFTEDEERKFIEMYGEALQFLGYSL